MKTSVNNFFSKQEQQNIKSAISLAEKNTSGEIRVHIENLCKGEVLDRAAFIFKLLEMHKTEKQNGVLIYLAVKSKKFAIIGDTGINKVVPAGFWDSIKQEMQELFILGKFSDGLCLGINKAGEQLKQFFPYLKGDTNELSDEISFSND